MNIQKLSNLLEERCEDYFGDIDHFKIFQQFITNYEEFIQFWEQSHQESTLCRKEIIDGQLSFQCFTCSDDDNHMMCYECFDTTKHQNHKCIISPGEGYCDCGNAKIIASEGHCDNHKASEQQQVLKQIPPQLAYSIENFIQSAIALYCQWMSRISTEYQKYDLQIIYFYMTTQQLDIKSLQKIVEQNFNIKDYFRQVCKTSYLYRILITFLEWLTIDKPIFQQLVIQILSRKNQYNQTIYETLISYQSLLEAIDASETQSIQQLLQILTVDDQFREFVIKANLAQSRTNWMMIEQSHSKFYDQVEELRTNMDENNDNFDKEDKQLIKEVEHLLNQYIAEIKKPQFLRKEISINQLYIWQIQSCDEFLMKTFMQEPNQVLVFKMISYVYKEIHTPNKIISELPFNAIRFFSRLFQTKGFNDTLFHQLEYAFGLQFKQFTSQPASKKMLKNFQMNDFVLTALINSLSEAKPISISEFNGNFLINEDIEEDALNYYYFQEEILRIIIKGIGTFLNSAQNTQIFKQNFIQLLLVKCYHFIKEKRNIYPTVAQEIQFAFSKYLTKNNVNKQHIERYNKILFVLLKNATFLDKLFIHLLWVDYCDRLFQQPQQLRDYYLGLFEESSIENIKINFQRILERCIQTNISSLCIEGVGLEEVYCGKFEKQEEEKEYVPKLSLESFDLAYVKMYLFLFDVQGLNDFRTLTNSLQVPNFQLTYSITNQNILKLLTSDIDVYNICYLHYHQQQELPSLLHSAFARIIQNILNIQPYFYYSTFERRFQDLNLMYSLESKRHTQKICELDFSVKKLRLQQQYQQIYDPVLFSNNIKQRALLLDRLSDRGKNQRVLLFGDGLEWILNQKKCSPIQQFLLFFISQTQIINDNLLLISKLQLDSQETFQLIFTQILAASYFRGEELQAQRQYFLQQFQNIIQMQPVEFQKYTGVLFKMITNQDYFQRIQSSIQINNNKLQQKKLIYKNQFLKNHQFQQKALTNNEKCCSYCLIPLNENNYVTPILVMLKTQSNNFSPFKNPENVPYNSIVSLLSINCCQHQFHGECIQQQFQQQSQNSIEQFPAWFRLNCPICIQACNLLMPMQQNIEKQDIINFNVALLNLVNNLIEVGLTKYTLTRHQGNQLNSLIDVYFQLIDDLIFQMLIDVFAFKRQRKDQILKQIYNLFLKFIESYKINGNFLEAVTTYVFNENVSLSQRILQLIQEHIVKVPNEAYIQVEMSKLVKELVDYHEITTILIEVFNLKPEMLTDQATQNTLINNEIIKSQTMKRQIFDKMRLVLGKTFQEFYHRYFPQKCDVCKFYAINFYDSADINVCLLCSKVFCSGKCSETQLLGNLNQHALQKHEGNSIYVSMVCGELNLVCSPLAIKKAKAIYYHKNLGQTIYQFDKNENWEDFILDEARIWEFAEVILNNQYQTKFKNLQVIERQVFMMGEV